MEADADRLAAKLQNATIIDFARVKKLRAEQTSVDASLTKNFGEDSALPILALIGFIVVLMFVLVRS